MKKLISTFLLTLILSIATGAEALKPYILAGVDQGSISEVQNRSVAKLSKSGFQVVGSYVPAEDPTLGVICVTHPKLKEIVGEMGDLAGFAAVLRVGLNQTETGIVVSYTDPQYWGNAFHRKNFEGIAAVYGELDAAFKEAFSELPETRFESFGSKKGLSVKKLQKYHYMMAMPYFDDVNELSEGSTYEEAVAMIEANAVAEDSLIEIVYSVKFPDQKMALYGTAIKGEEGEKHFLPKIDFSEPRHVPFLPYEMLVLDGKVISLHGKYRIALSFPDLTMGTFMKIMSTPGDIADAQKSVFGN